MVNRKGLLIKSMFAIGLIVSCYLAFSNIEDWPSTYPLLVGGLVATLVFMGLAISEVTTSDRIEKSEKILWIVLLIFLNNLAGILYIFWRRKHIIPSSD